MSKPIKIINGTLLTPHRQIRNGTLLVIDGRIADISERDIEVAEAEVLDAAGRYVAPGFIDLHIHGGGGHDFMDGSVDAFLRIAETHARYGTTAMVPTTLTSETAALYKTLDNYEEANRKNNAGAQFLGMHLEGPYFA
ncbi:MAG: amidohydrolase family protein, partial [Bacteroidetes bacterium]|nr:amidohydrolase family protein [Bacteroidota bacterium]